MRWFGFRRRADDEWLEAVRPELRGLRTPVVGDDLLDKVLTSRAAGTRVILPDARGAAARPNRRLVLSVVAAGLLLFVLPYRRALTPPSDAGIAPASGERTALEWMSASVAFAQTEPRDTRDVVPAMDFSHGDRLRPVSLEYERTWRDTTGRMTGRLIGMVTTDRDTVKGVPAWRLVSSNSGMRDGRAITTIDSVFVARTDLRLLRRTVLETPYRRYDEIRIVQAFSGDSVFGRMNAKGADATPAGRPIARWLPPSRGPYVADAFAPILFAAIDLRAGWTGSASLVGWAVVSRDIFMPVKLRVEGEDSVSVPAGRFDCWRLSVVGGRRAVSNWVRKSDGVGVRSVERMPNGERREVVLLKERSF